MKSVRYFSLALMAAVALGSVAAHAAGVDVQAFFASHADVLAGLSMLGVAGTTSLETEYKQVQADLKDVGDKLKAYAETAQKLSLIHI